jgi:3-hydroxyisobutyrate dehydrogenase
MPVGFIGLGNMGRPMAGHLLAAGERLVVYDIREDAAQPLVTAGAAWAETPADVARHAETIVLIVPAAKDVEVVVGGMLHELRPHHLVIDMTTSDPFVTQRLAREVELRGARLIDAPVSGGVKGAREASLSIMVGGEPEALERARPLLARMGSRIFHVGPVGTGHAMKLVNNVTSAACLVATAEAVAAAVRAGIHPARAVEIISASSGRSNASDWKFPQFILPGNYDSGFSLALMEKDVRGFLRLAHELGLTVPVAAVTREYFARGMEGPLAGGDHTEIVKLLDL